MLPLKVICRQYQNGFAIGEKRARVSAAFAGALAGHVFHARVQPTRKPALILRQVLRRVGCGDSAQGKTERAGARLDALSEQAAIPQVQFVKYFGRNCPV